MQETRHPYTEKDSCVECSPITVSITSLATQHNSRVCLIKGHPIESQQLPEQGELSGIDLGCQ
jgi:hypothetical protein